MLPDQDIEFADQSLPVKANPSRYNFGPWPISNDTKRRLSLYLDSVVRGSEEVFLTPIGERVGPSVILEKFDQLFSTNKRVLNDTLISIEENQREKYGPRSIAKPWSKRKENLDEYFVNHTSKSRFIPSSVSRLQLRPISLSNGVKLLKNNTNSGLPYYTRKGRVKDRVIKDYKELISAEYPCVLFTRTQEGNKTRNVWGYPIADTLREMIYYSPLLAKQKALDWRSAIHSPEKVDMSISKMINNKNKSNSFVSIDFTAYDSTIGKSLQDECCKYIKHQFQEVFHPEIDAIMNRFGTIGILTPSGVMSGQHGVPSGSTLTNEVDSIAQYIVAKDFGVEDPFIQIQGDDGAYTINAGEVDAFIKHFKDNGLNVNENKSFVSGEFLVYLQKLYHPFYQDSSGFIGGIYPLYRALCRIVYQERFNDFGEYDLSGVDYYSIRTISILENCKYHPLFIPFVKFISSLDKYKLGFSASSVSKYSAMASNGSGAGGILVNQYGDRSSGITSFKTWKVLKELNL